MKSLKKILIVFVTLIICDNVYAQNNLQFNTAKFIWLSCSGANCNFDTTIVIPENKVWKIESCAGGPIISLNGVALFYNAVAQLIHFPIWLPSGSYTLSVFGSPAATTTGFISAIEFNITP